MAEHSMDLTDPRRELERLREELAALRRDQALAETLRQQEWQCQREAERLRLSWDKEQADVDRLDRVSLSSLLANLTGRKAERLEKEEAEAWPPDCATRVPSSNWRRSAGNWRTVRPGWRPRQTVRPGTRPVSEPGRRR